MIRLDEALVVVSRPRAPDVMTHDIGVIASGALSPEYLVLLRSPEDHGYWHLVAGGVEAGEAPEAAARRELEEETGLAEPLRFERLPAPRGYRRIGDGLKVRVHPFAAEAPPGWEPVLNEEHVDYRWCSAEDAVRLLEYPEPREAIRAVERLRA